MKIFLIKKKAVKKYTYFAVHLIDAKLKIKINKKKYPNVYSFLRYPTKSYLKYILFSDDLGDVLYHRCGDDIPGVFNGRQFLFHIGVKFL